MQKLEWAFFFFLVRLSFTSHPPSHSHKDLLQTETYYSLLLTTHLCFWVPKSYACMQHAETLKIPLQTNFTQSQTPQRVSAY